MMAVVAVVAVVVAAVILVNLFYPVTVASVVLAAEESEPAGSVG